jgi:hypothetical protein
MRARREGKTLLTASEIARLRSLLSAKVETVLYSHEQALCLLDSADAVLQIRALAGVVDPVEFVRRVSEVLAGINIQPASLALPGRNYRRS